MGKLTLLVGPPGAGKSTLAKSMIENYGDLSAPIVDVNQDSQTKFGHMEVFRNALQEGKDIIVDRMDFNKQQREPYLSQAKALGYQTEIVVLHQPYDVCLERIRNRFGKHETINDEKSARNALSTFFGKYERPTEDEADKITFVYPEGEKPKAIYSDLDGSLANCEHRRHHVRRTDGKKKDWKAFHAGIPYDSVDEPVLEVIRRFNGDYKIVLCTGRDSNQKLNTVNWLEKHGVPYDALYMRDRSDHRPDNVIKEVLLDFEILTRFRILFCLDDRDMVVKMLRRRGLKVFQVAQGDF